MSSQHPCKDADEELSYACGHRRRWYYKVGKKGKMAQFVVQSLDWTLKMFIIMTKTGEILECPWSGQQSFRKTACLSHQHTPPIMIRLMWKGPSIITNRQRSSISTATPRINWWIETRAHQLKVVEYLLSLGYRFLSGRVSIPVACKCNTWLVNACEAFTS